MRVLFYRMVARRRRQRRRCIDIICDFRGAPATTAAAEDRPLRSRADCRGINTYTRARGGRGARRAPRRVAKRRRNP